MAESQQIPKLKTQYRISLPEVLHHVVSDEDIGGRSLFIVGDIHGCLDEFKQLLRQADITADKYLIICCGDLVNKGPLNCETVEFIRSLGSRNILSVRGNHDEKVIYEWKRWHKNTDELIYASWLKDLSKDDVEYLSELPYTLSVPSFGLLAVHAGLVPGVQLNQQQPINMTTMRGVIKSDVEGVETYEAVEKKSAGTWAAHWMGPEHVFFGHNASCGLQRHQFATGLDSGCVYGRELTAVVVPSGENHQPVFHSVPSTAVHRVPDI